MALDSALRDRVREGGDAGRVMSWLWGVVQGGGGEEREGAVRCLGDWCCKFFGPSSSLSLPPASYNSAVS